MPKKQLTAKQQAHIRQHYPQFGKRTLATQLNISVSRVQTFMRDEQLQATKQQSQQFRANALKGRTSFTAQEDAYIMANYLKVPIKVLAAQMGRSFTGITGRLKAMQLEIPAEIRAQRYKTGQFRKGQAPANKGKKQTEFMSPEAIARTAATRFVKGREPHNTNEIGEVVIRKRIDRNEPAYKWIKTSTGMVMLHHYNWTQANGPIPKGYILAFKSGDTMNCEVENLMLITREQNMQRNTIHRYPDELKEVIRLKGKIKRIRKSLNQNK